MVCVINLRGAASFATPTGWTLIGSRFQGNTAATNGIAGIEAYYCLRGASAPTLVFTRTAGDMAQARVSTFRSSNGAVAAGPTQSNVAQTSGQVAGASVSSIAGITPGQNGSLLVLGCSGADNGTWSALSSANITSGNWTALGASAGTNTGADGAIHAAYHVQATAAATGNAQGTLSIAGQNALVIAAFAEPAAAVNENDINYTRVGRGIMHGVGRGAR